MNGKVEKKPAPKTSTTSNSCLTKEKLERMESATPGPQSSGLTDYSKNPVCVSEDSHSTSSNSNSMETSAVSNLALTVKGINSGCDRTMTFVSLNSVSAGTSITNDEELRRCALLKRNETERLRAAKAILYESYCKAMRGE